MSNSTTTHLGLTLPAVGASQDSWGTKLNTNFTTLDNLLAGRNSAIAANGYRVGPDNFVENWGKISTSTGGVGQFFYAKAMTNVVSIIATPDSSTQQNYTATVYGAGSGTSCTVYTFLNGVPAACAVWISALGTI